MKLKRKMTILLGIGIILIITGLVIYLTSGGEYSGNNKQNHRDEFKITYSNYLERNYERYVAYKEKNDYPDDTIITHVNIGLDKNDYEDAEKTNIEDGLLMIINKHNTIDKDYKPKTTVVGDFDAEIADVAVKDFNEMVEAGKKQQVELFPVRAYLSHVDQETIYNMSITDDGEEKTKKTVPKAGYSDYQTGLAISISGNSVDFKLVKEYTWLTDHAYEYGFILRYPEGKEKITGFEYEPYHWRYVGKDVAKIIHDNKLTLEEYYATYVLK